MRAFSRVICAAIVLTLANLWAAEPTFAQRVYRDSDANMRNLISRIENRTDTFIRSLENALDRSSLNNTAREDEVNGLVADFETATDNLRSRFEARQSTAADVREVLNRAAFINSFMVNNRLTGRSEQDWRLLQTDLDALARAYYITDWRWAVGQTGPGSSWVDTRPLARRIVTRTTQFSRSFRQALNRPRTDAWQAEEARRHLVQFETAATRLRNVANNRNSGVAEARELLEHASYLNNFVLSHQLTGRAESDWTLLRTDLDQLASAYNIAWNWTGTPVPGGPIYSDGRLTGTYRLNVSRSGNPQAAADAATRNLPAARRQRVYDSLLRRLDAPDVLAIDQQGTNITIVSSRAPQINFVADGREHVETNPNGRTVRVRATMSGDQLVIDRTGERSQDFSVTFDPIGNGQLVVTRRLYSDQFTQPVTVQSYYDKTSEVAQLDIFRGSPDYGNVAAGDFVIPNNTQLVAVLDTSLDTERTRENERFTMTVRSPNQYSGARIEGYVTNVERSGRITGRSSFTMNFDRIRMPDGRTYAFAGMVESVRTADNETVGVDNEGAVRESDQTGRTITRTAIGTAVGAIIGAIAGGGQGAAIGAAIGAGAGAGSVYVQGRDDLELAPGTEVVVRATGPR